MGFSKTSAERLSTCHPELQALMNEAIKDAPVDFCIVCGHRGQEDQDKAFAQGYSKVKWPNGKHNKTPSEAVDVAPVIDGKAIFDDVSLFDCLAEHIALCAHKLNLDVVWGGTWEWKDYPHWERKNG